MSSLITIVSQSQRYLVAFLLVVFSLFFVQVAQASTVTEVKAEKWSFSNNPYILF